VIVVDNLSVRLGSFALDGISFEVAEGEYAVLMGKTGSGKTTILEAVCGLRPVAGGRIRLGGIDVTRLKPRQRGIGYVPQDAALFSTMTVREHLGFALVVRKRPHRAVHQRVEELAELLSIEHILDRRPQGLSGGEAQRVSLGRALAFSPGILCLDEPLSALDEATRDEMYALLRTVRAQTGVTVLHVTHSLHEAERLGDRFFVLAGRDELKEVTLDDLKRGRAGKELDEPPASPPTTARPAVSRMNR
jgi:molybdate/tungstate transport system ATP-binding protein